MAPAEPPTASSSWASHLECSLTGVSAPLHRPAFLSPAGRPWLVRYRLDGSSGESWRDQLGRRPWSLWRYRELLPVQDPDRRVDLGEGATPLVRLRHPASWLPGAADLDLWMKQEAGNPTGSFKDRGLSLAVNRARELGAEGVEIPSAGNAAISISAYAAAAGLPCRVALPVDTPEPVVRRCRETGAEVHLEGANLVESGAFLAGRPDAHRFWSLATLKEPYRAEGKKTMGLEIAEQLGWQLPDWILYPTGGGTGIVGMAKAFDELEALGLIGPERPRLVAVQMSGCAPIVRAFHAGLEEAEPWEEPTTNVWGLRVPVAIGDRLILDALRTSDGRAVAVDEHDLEPMAEGFRQHEGLVLGPEGAAVLVALGQLVEGGEIPAGNRVVLFQTGHPANY